MIVYRRHEQPGCGGCLFVVALIMLAFGGAPLLFNFLGFLFFTVFFLFLMAAIGFYAFTYYIRKQVSEYERSQTESHNRFVFLLVNILVKIAQADGQVTKEEIAAITNFFRYNLNYSQSRLYWVRELIKEAAGNTATLDALLTDFRSSFAYEPRLILFELINQVAFTNQSVSPQELELINNIARYLEISPYDQQSIQSRYMSRFREAAADEDRFYATLGLSPGASFEEIKSAYRKLSMQYHPDKVNHLGEEFRKVAEEKMKEINIAYQQLKRKFD